MVKNIKKNLDKIEYVWYNVINIEGGASDPTEHA